MFIAADLHRPSAGAALLRPMSTALAVWMAVQDPTVTIVMMARVGSEDIKIDRQFNGFRQVWSQHPNGVFHGPCVVYWESGLLPMWPSEPVTRWMSCSASMPSASTATGKR